MPAKTRSLASKIGKLKQDKLPPLWEGPQVNSQLGGVTQSMLGSYINDGERFRVRTIDGLEPVESRWDHRIGYGNLWHACEEKPDAWLTSLQEICRKFAAQHPLDIDVINHWYKVCKVQFPIYLEHWSKHPDVTSRKVILAEHVFCVPYRLPSGRTVYLRGRWDSVDLIGQGKSGGIYQQENKTKGDVDEDLIQRQLMFDLQTGFYQSALVVAKDDWIDYAHIDKPWPVRGVRYNVVRRPLSGGQFSISQSKGTKGAKCNLKCCREAPSLECVKCNGTGRVGALPPETDEHFYDKRLREIIELNPDHFFHRWKTEVSAANLQQFQEEFLHPALENLCDDYEWWTKACWQYGAQPWDYLERQRRFPQHYARHYRLPYGTYNAVMLGRSTELDEYLDTGNSIGLRRADRLFKELVD